MKKNNDASKKKQRKETDLMHDKNVPGLAEHVKVPTLKVIKGEHVCNEYCDEQCNDKNSKPTKKRK